jgi:hypothetical protein
MSQQLVLAACPQQHQAAMQAEVAKAPTLIQSTVWAWIQWVIAQLQAAGKIVNWQQIIALIPLLIAAFANPAAWPAFIAAVLALFVPTPSPIPAPPPIP